jgi:hemoglobin-like flavoprotein
MDQTILTTFDESLQRCNARPGFLDLFYEKFLASSPKVKEKFANTDMIRQKRALRTSLHLMLMAAGDGEEGPKKHLADMAERHSSRDLKIGAELYDLWLDCLLDTVKESDPEYDDKVREAWDEVMSVGIGFMLSHFQ